MLSCLLFPFLYWADNKDHPPKAAAGQDRVVQPHDVVVLTGLESKDDHKIAEFLWVQVSGNQTAVIEVCKLPHNASGSTAVLGERQELFIVLKRMLTR